MDFLKVIRFKTIPVLRCKIMQVVIIGKKYQILVNLPKRYIQILLVKNLHHSDSEHVYMRPEVNSNRFEISLRGKISLRCEVTSLSAFT